ncbi:MAG TPA: hypothetical protein PKX94_08160, partial [Opitutales bacterium]|nr:hypothetical protein [Opitutales bacterium]
MKRDRRILETAIAKHGDGVVKAFDEGGYALLKAARTNGDEVISGSTAHTDERGQRILQSMRRSSPTRPDMRRNPGLVTHNRENPE